MQVRRRISIVAFSAVVGFTLACEAGTTSVEGDRASHDGGCPEGQVCDESVGGLMFLGQSLYDEGWDHLGPVLVGGRFDLSFFTPGSAEVGSFDVQIDGGALSVGDLEEQGVELWGEVEGDAIVQIVDAESGALLDQLTLRTVLIDDVELKNVSEPSRPHLLGGCDEMIGVRLVADGGLLRAFDQNVRIEGPGDIAPEPLVWDCFRATIPTGVDEASFTITAGGETFVVTFDVEEPGPGEQCPDLGD